MTAININDGGVATYTSLSNFPTSTTDGQLAVAKDTDSLYEFDGPSQTWVLIGPSGGGGGTVTAVTASLPLASSGGTAPNITLPKSTSVQDGYLSSADWGVFNAKQPAGSYITSLTGDVTASGPGAAASTIAAGAVTNAKIATAAGISVNKLAAQTANRAIVSDASGFISTIATTSTELGFVSGVTSAIQTQLNAKAAHVIPTTNQVVYVSSLSGSNVTGDGSYDKPWATVAFAMTQITDSSSTKPYTISIMAGRQIETTDVLWKPYVFIVGSMQRASYIRINGGSFKPDASMSANSWIGFQNIYIGGGTAINMDMQSVGGNNLEFIIENCTLSGALTIKGRNAGGGDFLEMYNCLTLGTITLDSVLFQIQTTEMGAALVITNTQASGATGTVDDCVMDVGITTAEPIFLNDVAYTSSATFTTTAAVTVASYRGLPPKALRTLFAGTTITNYDDSSMLPYTPTTPGNWSVVPTDVKAALDTLAAAVPTAVYKVNEFTLSSTDITNKFVTLSGVPVNPTLTVLQVVGGGVQAYTTDFTVSGSTLSWSGLFLDGVLVAGDKLIIQFY